MREVRRPPCLPIVPVPVPAPCGRLTSGEIDARLNAPRTVAIKNYAVPATRSVYGENKGLPWEVMPYATSANFDKNKVPPSSPFGELRDLELRKGSLDLFSTVRGLGATRPDRSRLAQGYESNCTPGSIMDMSP